MSKDKITEALKARQAQRAKDKRNAKVDVWATLPPIVYRRLLPPYGRCIIEHRKENDERE